ncbi:glycosyltransferase family 25 protein [Apiospora rasikravindrae]|uniref:Glycosyltransferase family 25 protein n=1 Tax=Apiospora rasikravindrae TaxID=990691 RepID=A0ABR1SM76_9PEZI
MPCGAGLGRSFIARIALALVILTVTLCFLWYRDLVSPPSRVLPHAPFSILQNQDKQQQEPAATITPAAPHAQQQKATLGPRNETLGFDAILALSKGGSQSWRVQGLQAAAKLSGLNVIVPPQPTWLPEMVEAFAALSPEGVPKPEPGSAAAWLAHIDLLKYVLQSQLNSALIVEDDVDWDIHIKDQMSNIAEAVRQQTHAPHEQTNPYGSKWDILWIGHCGDTPMPNETVSLFQDPTVLEHKRYVGFAGTKSYLQEHIPEGQRAVYRSQGAVCSYAYAVHKSGVRKVLDFVSTGLGQAYDTKLFYGCRSGMLNCIAVTPEVMVHFRPDSKFGQTSEVDRLNDGDPWKAASDDGSIGGQEGGGHPEKVAASVAEKITGTTNNIRQSARCMSLWKKACIGGHK